MKHSLAASRAAVDVAASTTLLPQHVLDAIADLPPMLPRRRGAEEIKRHLGIPISHRTLETWPVPTQCVCGKALIPTVALFEVAYSKLTAAPVVMGGRRTISTKAAA